MSDRATRILELRSVRGTGGGPEKTILRGTARTDPDRYRITVCYVRDTRDRVFAIGEEAARLGVDYVEVEERNSFDWRVLRQLRGLVRSRGIQIVHAHEYKTDLLAILLARTEGVIPLATVHGWTGASFRERRVYYPLDKRVLRRYPRLIAVSTDIRNELVAHGVDEARIEVVLNAIDERAFTRIPGLREEARRQLGYDDDHIVVGSIGRVERQKRYDLLIEAFARLAPHRPALRLVIAGDGSLRDDLRKWAAQHGVESACSFLGHRQDVRALNHAFDVFVQSSEYEGTPNAVLEAMACETPLVATDVGGTSELARPGIDALIVPPGDVPALAAGISACIDAQAATAERVAAARGRIVSDLSFSTRMAKVERIYDELVLPSRTGVSGRAEAACRPVA